MSAHVLLNLLNELGEKIRCTNARFYLPYNTEIAFCLQILNQNVSISPLENATFLWTSTYNIMALIIHNNVICIFNPLGDYCF